MTERPQRTRIFDESGRAQTLPDGSGQFDVLPGSGPLFFGLGPRPDLLPEWFPDAAGARYVECPDAARQYGEAWLRKIPLSYHALAPEELTPALLRTAEIFRYKRGPRLFSAFWGPLFARCELARSTLPAPPAPSAFFSAPPRASAAAKSVWLPLGEGDLLRIELTEAFAAAGWSVRALPPDDPETVADALLQGGRPDLLLSVNAKGLDPHGRIFHLLREAGTRVAVWFVDNPFHLLTGLRSPFWTETDLFVTDAWFLAPLRRHGARRVHHLPLAVSTTLFHPDVPPPSGHAAGIEGRTVFVGRSAFPDKDAFFAGCALPGDLWAKAQAGFELGERADFSWWLERFSERGIDQNYLWPGNDVRQVGYCAEQSGRHWRTACLRAANTPGKQHGAPDISSSLTIFGDEGWSELLPPGTDLRGPVDYYAALPSISRHAGCCLNMTSPLLPAGLTQRNFDVWAAGGLLLTDASPGLSIFPAELTAGVTFRTPSEIAPLREKLVGTDRGDRLRAAWREHILSAHTYAHRLDKLFESLDGGPEK